MPVARVARLMVNARHKKVANMVNAAQQMGTV
jgi:hypothetical protein